MSYSLHSSMHFQSEKGKRSKQSAKLYWDKLPETKTLNLHSAMFPDLSEAKYRMLCSPAGNESPGCFP